MNFFTYIFILCLLGKGKSATKDNYLLLVISLDGFRHDYLDKYSNKNGFLREFAKSGFKAAWSESIFPSNTYPNHYSIVTGLYAESHGVINNHVYDPLTNKRFRMGKDREDSDGWFQNAEPIWIKNQKVNIGKQSVVFDWPGSPASFNGTQAYSFRQENPEFSQIKNYNKTVDLFIESLLKNKTNLGFLYFNEPDKSGHAYGPESKEVEYAVKELDYVLNYLFQSLKSRKGYDIENEIDTIILTDHGMATVHENASDTKNFFYLSDYFDVNQILIYDKCNYGALSELWLKDEEASLDKVFKILSNNLIAEDKKKISGIYLKKDIPERFHLKYSYRVAPIILVANTGYQIVLERNKEFSVTKQRATHGYSPDDVQMRGIFLANGKSFKKFSESNKPVKLIDIYGLMCHVLDLKPNVNNGTLDRITHVLVNFNDNYKIPFFVKFFFFIILYFLIYYFVKHTFRKNVFLVNLIYVVIITIFLLA